MIVYRTDKTVNLDKLKYLFDSVGWSDKTADEARLKAMVENSQIVVTAWDNREMVGFARCTTDYVFNGQINNVVVQADYRGQGIGARLINTILESSPQVTYILRGDIENQQFYSSIGFQGAPLSLVYKRRD